MFQFIMKTQCGTLPHFEAADSGNRSLDYKVLMFKCQSKRLLIKTCDAKEEAISTGLEIKTERKKH